MGNCIKRKTEPKICDLITISTVSSSVRLSSTRHIGIHEAFIFIKYIGQGQYGTVRLAFRKSHSQDQLFAIKSILKQNIFKHRQILKRELEILAFTDHPNIVKLYQTFEDQLYLHLVLEYCSGGDVLDRVIQKGSVSEAEASKIMKQLLSAVNYLHSNKITHRDLKPDNFLYETPESNIIKICDFGMSIKSEFSKMKSLAGTPYYLAPEVLKGNYTKACDIWSLGVFMHFLLSGKHPFKGSSAESVYIQASGGYEAINMSNLEISEKAKNLLKSLLTVKEHKRITAASALKHPWFDDLSKTSMISTSVFNSLRKYNAKNKLWQEAIKIIVKNLSNKQIEDLRSAFLNIDLENTGYITAQDLHRAMNNHGMVIPTEEVDLIIRNISAPQEGKIKYSDFLAATLVSKEGMNEQLLWEAFQVFDKGSTGKIRKLDLEDAIKTAGCDFTEDEYRELIAEANLGNEESIDYSSFKMILGCFEEHSVSRESGSEKITVIRRLSKDLKLQFERLSSA